MLDNILAGPILRSTTSHRICVWLALDSEQDITLEILDLKENPLGRSASAKLEKSRFKLGNQLFVYLLQAYPLNIATTFETGKLCYYRLLDGQDKVINLKTAGLTYGNHEHPIFSIPEKLSSILHGSCRKPHGDSDKDCLTIGDTLLEAHHNDLSKRPDLLLLTGDQIYADDVEASLLSVLREQAKNLTGSYESLPWLTQKYQKKQVSGLDSIKLGARAKVLKNNNSGFSSSESGNHLISFGEFSAMYIYVFGNAKAWQKPGSWDEIQDQHIPLQETIKLTDHLSKWGFKSDAEIIAEKQRGFADHLDAVNTFSDAKSLLKVRRLLANVPTYMIFDDHDVTDDWNITGSWYSKVRSSPLGRRIVSNALAAYWAFQGWGNDPDNFDAEMIAAITSHLNDTTHNADISSHYDLMTWKHRGWGFTIATTPPIIAMDSRTQRESEIPFYPPRLMDRYALDWLQMEWSYLKTSKKITPETCPLLIATTPVLGFSPLEHFVRFGLWLVSYVESTRFVEPVEKILKLDGFLTSWLVNFLDAEAWTANLNGFTAFLDTVLHKMKIEKCVFLSGDVHYSFTAKGFYKSGKNLMGSQKTLNCYQLTSSSLRNEPSVAQAKALDKLESFEENKTLWQHIKHQIKKLQALRGWQIEHTLLPSNLISEEKPNKPIIEQCNLGHVFFDEHGQVTKHSLLINPDDANESVDYSLSAL